MSQPPPQRNLTHRNNQPTAGHRDDDEIALRPLLGDLQPAGSLTGHRDRIEDRVHERRPVDLLRHRHRPGEGGVLRRAARTFDGVDNGYANLMSNVTELHSTVPGMKNDASQTTIELLQERLASLLDLHLTLKHVHWNVVGMNFIAIHEMLDPQVDKVRDMSDAVAERIATLGGQPLGTPAAIVEHRSWEDYGIGRAPTVQHLVQLDKVYTGVIGDYRAAAERLGDLDPVSEDLLVGHLHDLELFQWFVRAHLQDAQGDVVHRSSYEKS